MAGVNQCNFVGNLGRDPEMRTTQAGKAVCNFSIAVNEKWNGQEHTEWVNVVAWGKLAEICGQYLTKGREVYVSGRMQTRKWQDRDGNDKYTTEIVANTMQMLGPAVGGQRQERGPAPAAGRDDYDDSQIPF